MFAHPQPTTTPYNAGSLAFTRGPGLEEMRAKSDQIVCETQKGEKAGARATVMSFAKKTTSQSNINTNHHPADYCQVSAVLNLHIQILSGVSAWSIPQREPGQPEQSCSGAASHKPPSGHNCLCLERGSTSCMTAHASSAPGTAFTSAAVSLPPQLSSLEEAAEEKHQLCSQGSLA